MPGVRTIEDLGHILGFEPGELDRLARHVEAYCEDLEVIDPARPGKVRGVVNVMEPLRSVQTNLLCNFLKPNLRPSPYSHGGIRGRSVVTNAEPHRDSAFYFACDIADFYPTISHHQVYWLFSRVLGCSRQVTRICTKLCTRGGRLAQGLIASPMIADRLMAGPDRRIGRLCDKLSEASSSPVIYTRYVDDLTISAKFPIESGSTPKLVLEILKGYGFDVNPDKSHVGRLSDVRSRVTKLRIHRGRVDVSPEFVALVDRQIRDSVLLAAGQNAVGPYYTPQQIFGRIQFIGWVNEGRLGGLLRAYNSVDWPRVEAAALERGLVVCRKQLRRKRRNISSPE